MPVMATSRHSAITSAKTCAKPPHPRFTVLLALLLLFLGKTSAQCVLVCKQNLLVSLDPAGLAPIGWQMIAPTAGNSCPGPLEIFLRDEQGIYLPDDTLRCAHVGQTIRAEVRHTPSGNRCNSTLQVRDGLSPQIACPDKMVFCLENTDPAAIGLPAMTDNCTPPEYLTTNYLDQHINFPCGTEHNGLPIAARLDRRWFTSDQSGNTASCIERIWIRQATIADVTFPPNRDGFSLPTLACGQNPEDLDLTGQPTINGLPLVDAVACEVAATYTDQALPYCPPAGYSIIRTWLLVDFCNSQVAQRIQIIKVEDKNPPLLTPPANLTVGTLPFQCAATVTLPSGIATDSCSAVSISPVWEYGNGYGPFSNVPLGEHLVTYVATDACGNTAEKTMLLTVADQTPPQAVCKGAVQISLGSDGTATVFAAMLDGGSFDNCGGVSFSLSRDEVEFSPSLTLTCADRDTALTLTLRVQDDNLLENFCPVQVTVRDLLRPLLQCPANTTLSCLQDYTDPLLAGTATATDNCAMVTLGSTDVVALNACRIGTVSRTWKAADATGNTRTCVQQILLKAVSDVQVAFPPNLTVAACAAPNATDPSATGQPVVTGQFCYPLSITHTDQVFQSAPPPACFRILRTWKIIDFCTHDPNSGTTGYWEHTQIIDVRDDLPPVLQVPDHLTLSPDLPGCRAAVLLPEATATDCSAQPSIAHDSPHAAQPGGANCSGNYPLGTHFVTFTATDGCGNSVQKTLKITVQDIEAPQAKCASAAAVNLSKKGLATVQPDVLDAGSTDNCTSGDVLMFQVIPSMLDCQHLGIQKLVLKVTDEAGNTGTCSTQVTVTDTLRACKGDPYDLAGSIRTSGGLAVAEIPVQLSGGLLTEISDCDSAGRFAFSDVPSQEDYALRPRSNTNWLNGVSTYDLVLISKHILGLQPLPGPYHMIAADANRSGSITTFDIVVLRKLILGIDDTLSNNSSWRFVPKNFVFPNPDNPFANGGFPEQIALPGLSQQHDSLDFVGIKVGDTNLSADAADPRSPRDTVFLAVPNIGLAPGQAVAVPLTLPNWSQLEGFQFELGVDTTLAKIQKVEFLNPGQLNEGHLALRSGGSGAALSWQRTAQVFSEKSGTPLVVLHLMPQRAATLHDAVFISPKKLVSEVYFSEKQEFAHLALRIQDPADEPPAAFAVLPARPNPFREATSIPFHLPAPAEMTLTLSDVQGHLLLERTVAFPAGQSEWQVRQEGLPESGVLFFRLTMAGGESRVGKLVRF